MMVSKIIINVIIIKYDRIYFWTTLQCYIMMCQMCQ